MTEQQQAGGTSTAQSAVVFTESIMRTMFEHITGGLASVEQVIAISERSNPDRLASEVRRRLEQLGDAEDAAKDEAPPDRARPLTNALMATRPGIGGGSNEVVDADLGRN